jgi:hypothetical protein
MTRIRLMFAALVAALAFAAVPSASAQCPNGTPGNPCLHIAAAGSSAIYQQAAITIVNDIAPHTAGATGGGTIHHYTIKGSCSDGKSGVCAGLVDSRNPVIPVESATYWLVWVCSSNATPGPCDGGMVTDVWLDNQVDTTVGDREFLARPAAQSWLAAGVVSGVDPATTSQTNLINSGLFLSGDTLGAPVSGCVAGHLTTCDAPTVPSDVYAVANQASLNASFSDTRPEDALFATERANSALTGSPWTGLGYGGGPTTKVGASVVSSFTGTFATPVLFGLPGTADPFTGTTVPSTIETFAVGVEPVVIIANRTNPNGLGNVTGVVPFYTNVVDNAGHLGTQSPIGLLFGGTDCSGSSSAFGLGGATPGGTDFAVNPILREPLSGTMNTTEFSIFRTYGGSLPVIFGSSVGNATSIPTTSQEAFVAGVNPLGGAGPNPPGTPCNTGLGKRRRAVGTGEEVGKPCACSSSITGVGCTEDGIGYTFYSFANVSSLAKNASYGYLTLDGVDPLFNNYAGGDPGQPATTAGTIQGELPACSVANNGSAGGCETTDVWTGGNSFPHLRDGTYRAWSILRALCDTSAVTCLASSDHFGLEAAIEAAQDDIHNHLSDSVADILPMSLDGSFGPAGTIFGDVSFVRSHYAFNSAVGVGVNGYPGSHTTPSFQIFPAGINADQATGTGASVVAGGDAGGCIISIRDTGSILQISKATFPAPNVQHIKFTYALVSGPQPEGICGGGANNGQFCTSSNTGPKNPNTIPPAGECGSVGYKGDPANPFGYTCNPVPQGMSMAVTGMTNNKDNGVFQVTKITDLTDIKVKVPTGGGDPVPVALSGQTTAQAGVSTGCVQ